MRNKELTLLSHSNNKNKKNNPHQNFHRGNGTTSVYFGIKPSMKMTFDGRQPSMKDDLRWKSTFDGSQPSMEDDL